MHFCLYSDSIKDVSVTLVPLPYDKTDSSERKVNIFLSFFQILKKKKLLFKPKICLFQQKPNESNLSVLQSSHISGGPSNTPSTESKQFFLIFFLFYDRKRGVYKYSFLSFLFLFSFAATTSAVSLVVSVPLSTASLSGVNLTNTNSNLHQTPTVKSFGSIDGQQVSAILLRIFVFFFCLFVKYLFWFFFFVCVFILRIL